MNASTPPSLPVAQPPTIPKSESIAVQTTHGRRTLTVDEAQRAVAAGARFVVFQYCISVVVMSFKRASDVYLVLPGQSTTKPALQNCLISFFVGWWGIPWGPIWTVWTIAVNLGGGKDVTADVMNGLGLAYTPGARTTVTSTAPPPLGGQPPVIAPIKKAGWPAWKIVTVVLLCVGLVFGYGVFKIATNMKPTPGRTQFSVASSSISSSGEAAGGNSPEARRLAAKMSTFMKTIRDKGFEQAEKKSIMDQHDIFRTYCDLRTNHCVFLVHVPELRRFDSDSKKLLGEAAWMAAEKFVAASSEGRPGMKLAVGLKGIAAYDRILVGAVIDEPTKSNTGVTKVHTFGGERELYSWFADTQ